MPTGGRPLHRSWREPPRSEAEVKAETYPLLEEPDLLSDPNAVLEQEQQLLAPATGPSTTP